MKPEVGEHFSGQGLGLCDFIFVMRKDEILAAGVQIESFAQFLHRHGGTFDMPSRPPLPDRTLPERLAFFGRLPQREVAGVVFFVLVHIHTRAVFHSGEILLGKFAVSGKLGNAKVIGAVVGTVGESFFFKFSDELGHPEDVIGGASENGLFDVQSGTVL